MRRDGITQHYWTGRRPTLQKPRYTAYYPPRDIYRRPPRKLVIRGIVVAVIQLAPMGRELYICYTTAHLVYSSWKIIHEAYQKPERLKEEAYGIARDEAKRGLTSVQAGLIWDKIEYRVPEPLKAEVNESLTKVMSNVSEEEISLVEYALAAF